MAIVLELLSRKNKTIQHYKFDKSDISIGRDYGNDLRLDDPYVCAEHIKLSMQESTNELLLDDCNSRNGISVNGKLVHSALLQSNDIIKLGRTRLRIVDCNAPIADSLPLSELEEKLNWLNSTSLAITLTLAYLLFSLVIHHLSSIEEFQISKVLPKEFGQIALFCIWPIVFATLAKVFKKESHLVNQFNLLWLVLFLLNALYLIEQVLVFNIGDSIFITWLEFLTFGSVVFAFVWFSLFIAFHQSNVRRNIITATMSLVILLPIASLGMFGSDEFNSRPNYHAPLLSPLYSFSQPTNTDSFILNSETLFVDVKNDLEKNKLKLN